MTRPDLEALAREHFSDMQNKMCLAVPVTVGLVEGFAAKVAAHERARFISEVRAKADQWDADNVTGSAWGVVARHLADELENDK